MNPFIMTAICIFIGVALAAAKALEALGEMPAACLVEVSGNAIKNIESVTVPGTDVLKEIRTAVATGVIGGQPWLGWEVLSQITADEIEEINDFLQNLHILGNIPFDFISDCFDLM